MIKGRTVPVIIFTDREKALEIVSGPIKTQGRKQPGCPTVSIQERVDMHKLKM